MNNEDLQQKIMRGAGPIVDLDVLNCLKEVRPNQWLADNNPDIFENDIQRDYKEVMTSWLNSHQRSCLYGLETFPSVCVTNGITESLADFILTNNTRKIKILKGEYVQVSRILSNFYYLEDIEAGDAIIISCPFSATGVVHKDFISILERAEILNVPVMIDAAFYGISQNVQIDLNYSCIKKIAFSNSKNFASGNCRVGLEFRRYSQGLVGSLNEWNYQNLMTMKIHMNLMENFPINYLFNKYRKYQLRVCDLLQIEPSDTLIIGIGDKRFESFSQEGVANRCCLSKLIRHFFDQDYQHSCSPTRSPPT